MFDNDTDENNKEILVELIKKFGELDIPVHYWGAFMMPTRWEDAVNNIHRDARWETVPKFLPQTSSKDKLYSEWYEARTTDEEGRTKRVRRLLNPGLLAAILSAAKISPEAYGDFGKIERPARDQILLYGPQTGFEADYVANLLKDSVVVEYDVTPNLDDVLVKETRFRRVDVVTDDPDKIKEFLLGRPYQLQQGRKGLAHEDPGWFHFLSRWRQEKIAKTEVSLKFPKAVHMYQSLTGLGNSSPRFQPQGYHSIISFLSRDELGARQLSWETHSNLLSKASLSRDDERFAEGSFTELDVLELLVDDPLNVYCVSDPASR